MKTLHAVCVALLAAAAAASFAPATQAQPVREAKDLLLDMSSEALIDSATSKAVLRESIPARVWKLYPEGKWTFLSLVKGGVSGGTCVVTATVVLLPRTGTVRAVLWRPEKSATVYDAKPGLAADACKALAKDKLKEAATAVSSSIAK
jgi:hypothetical protein